MEREWVSMKDSGAILENVIAPFVQQAASIPLTNMEIERDNAFLLGLTS